MRRRGDRLLDNLSEAQREGEGEVEHLWLLILHLGLKEELPKTFLSLWQPFVLERGRWQRRGEIKTRERERRWDRRTRRKPNYTELQYTERTRVYVTQTLIFSSHLSNWLKQLKIWGMKYNPYPYSFSKLSSSHSQFALALQAQNI